MNLLAALKILLKAKSKKAVDDIFVEGFEHRNRDVTPERALAVTTNFPREGQVISTDEATLLLDGIKTLIKQALYLNTSRDELMQLLPGALDAPLKDLIATIIMHRMPEWRKQIISSQISLPRLEEINWRVDVKSASDLIGQMSVPTVLVEMQIRDGDLPPAKQVRKVQFELSKEGLQTVLEGLGKIRDQLSSTAAAAQ